MNPSFSDRLTELQARASRLQQIASGALAVSAGPAEASDRAGAVTVRLAHDGLPESIRLGWGWRRSIESTALASAVHEACQLAMAKRMSAWHADVERSGVSFDADSGQGHRPGASTPPSTPTQAAFAVPADVTFGSGERPASAIIEEVFSLIDTWDQPGALPNNGNQGRGTAAGGKVVLALSNHALVSCDIDSDWAQTQTDSTIQSALSAALSAARTGLARAQEMERESPTPQRRAEMLALELLSRMSQGRD